MCQDWQRFGGLAWMLLHIDHPSDVCRSGRPRTVNPASTGSEARGNPDYLYFHEEDTMNVNKTKGFTLIELMIVVAIIAILAAIALPAYQNYIKRSKVTEGIVAADACKSSVVEYVASENTIPPNQTAAGCGNFKASQYLSSLDYDGTAASITVTFKSVGTGVDGNTYELAPSNTATAASGQLTGWSCTGSSVNPELLPASCRG
jgi:type IV pilus assembly protein PilA